MDIVGSFADSVALVEKKVIVLSSYHIMDSYWEAQNKQERLHM